MEPHINSDNTITLGMRKDIENSMNGHCLQLGRIIKLGQNHNHWSRMKSALVNKFGHIPVLYGLKKEHKFTQPNSPTPTRPVCGANDAPNGQICNILSIIVSALAMTMDEDLKTVSRSTEEMIAAIEEINKKDSMEERVIFSTDVEAMYPSLDIASVAAVAREEFVKSKLKVEIDNLELSLYQAIIRDKKELDDLD